MASLREYSQGEANTRLGGRGIKSEQKEEEGRYKKKETVQHKKHLQLNYTFTHG